MRRRECTHRQGRTEGLGVMLEGGAGGRVLEGGGGRGAEVEELRRRRSRI